MKSRIRCLWVVSAAVGAFFLAQSQVQAQQATLNLTPATRAGTVKITVLDFLMGPDISASVPLNFAQVGANNLQSKVLTVATALAQAITAYNNNAAANVMNGLPATVPWTVAVTPTSVTVNKLPNKGVTVIFNPSNTGEKRDTIMGGPCPGIMGQKGDTGDMGFNGSSIDLLDPSTGDPYTFVAGLTFDNSYYEASLMGNDPTFGGANTASGATITQLLETQLAGMVPSSAATFDYTAGSTDITALFNVDSIDAGLTCGTDSDIGTGIATDGPFVSLSPVPEPVSMGLLLAGAVVGLGRRTKRLKNESALSKRRI